MVWEGPGAVAMVRAMMGPTNPAGAPGTIRGDLAVDLGMNVMHGSDSPESAAARWPCSSRRRARRLGAAARLGVAEDSP